MDYRGKKLWSSLGFGFNLDKEYEEKFIKNYRKFHKIIDKAHVLKSKEIKGLKNINTKCYFGRGSYPVSISSWQVKTNALLYDTFIFDSDTFRNMVIGAPDLDENEILRLNLISPIDIEASEFLMNLYRSGCIKLVNSPFIWNNMFGGDMHTSLKHENKLYTDKEEIEEISMSAALFPGDEHNYPGFLQLMNEDILVSYLTNSSIITHEYAGYISRKLGESDQIISKNKIVNQVLKYEVPNFDSLDYDNIYKIRGLRSISKFRNKIEGCSQNISADNSNIEEIIQGFRDELWKLALDNIEDNKTKIIVESLISNLPVLSSLFSARDLLKVNELQDHWGYTVLQLKKTVASLRNKENLNNHQENLRHFDQDNISLNFDDYLFMAQEYHNQEEYEKALEAINNALKLRPDDFSTIINKIIILKNLNYESLETLDKLIETDPKCSTHWLNKGRVLNDLGLYEEALIAYKKAIEVDPENPHTWYNAGRFLASILGKYSESIEYFDMALKIEPNFDAAWMCKGSAYGDLKEHDEAIKYFDKAISINPYNSCAWSNKGSALFNIGRLEDSLEAYVKSLEVYPNNGFIWYLIGNVYKTLNEEKKALEAYNKAVELDPSISTIVSKAKINFSYQE